MFVSNIFIMSIYNLILWDDRVRGRRPARGHRTYQVNNGTHLSWILRNVAERAQAHRGQTFNLHIIAHGFERPDSSGHMVGGWGINICREGINIHTLRQFERWNGLVNNIFIYSCSAARIASNATADGDGDGNFLCYRLAQITGAHVFASTANQVYLHDNTDGRGIDVGRWEGRVFAYSPDGRSVQLDF
jgi:hypothetical protein